MVNKKMLMHIKIKSGKKIHNWYPGKRECTSERILLNPYIGCEVGCFFCYALSYPGNFQKARKEKVIFVYENFVENLKEQIEKINLAFCGYLSPITEPFQSLEKIYHLSEKTIELLIEKNIPVEFITKEKVPDSVVEKIKTNQHSFGQVSILTPYEEVRKKLMKKGATTSQLFKNIEKLSKSGIHCVCRIDPIIPFITDNKKDLILLIKRAVDSGVNHIVASVMDIPIAIKNDILNYVQFKFGIDVRRKIEELYCEKIGMWLNADINYRKNIFSLLRENCDKFKVSFALCMEYEKKNGKIIGLNKEFMSSNNCEGIDIPIYFRMDKKFYPYICKGDCLKCKDAICGIIELAQGNREDSFQGWDYYDYLKWSRIYKIKGLL